MLAAQARSYGGADAIDLVTLPTPEPGPGQVRVRVEAAGVNFIDVYQRTGLYPTQEPVRLGLEGAGVVEALGPGVSELAAGARVAWAAVPGSYATHVVAPVDKLVAVPDGVDAPTAAAAMLQGMTAHYLARSTFPLEAGRVCLVHAAAGGVGRLLCQLAKAAGARVFGTVSTDDKARIALEAGADEVIRYRDVDFAAECRRLTDGRGVDVVYDSVGKTTFDASLSSLKPRGMLVLFGQSSGSVPPFDAARLAGGGSLFLTRPRLGDYTATRAELVLRSGEVFAAIGAGKLAIAIHASIPLAETARAHRMLEGRETSGKVILLP